MAHWSENTKKLGLIKSAVGGLAELDNINRQLGNVYLLWLPFLRNSKDASESESSYQRLVEFCSSIDENAVVCVLTTPLDAALLLPLLEQTLQFQLWVAIKTTPDAYPAPAASLRNRHASLLVLTKYRGSLRHTKTRIQYTYCPACGKTTKDYGGKKHTYHEYGTLLSDVWRDVEINPIHNIDDVADRISDLFGLDEYRHLQLIDMRACLELAPLMREAEASRKDRTMEDQVYPSLESLLLNDDSLIALKTIPDNSIDFCFADPPYNLKKKYDKWDDALESVKYFAWCDKWLSELYRVLKPGRTLAVLNIPLWAVRHYQHLSSLMDFQAWIVWDGLSFPVRMVMPAHYAIICFSKGKARPLPGLDSSTDVRDKEHLTPLAEFYCLRVNCIAKRRRGTQSDRSTVSDLWHDVHRLKHNSRRVDHPCQLPPALMWRLYALFTRPNEIILDCFNGAGTSTLAAQQMNRRFVGIELSKQYHELAAQRHEQLTMGVDPFRKIASVPTAKNSPVARLPKQKYQVSKKALQLEVRRIANEIGHLPTREDVMQRSEYPIEYFEKYFVSWGEVCAAARTTGMTENPGSLQADPAEKQNSFNF